MHIERVISFWCAPSVYTACKEILSKSDFNLSDGGQNPLSSFSVEMTVQLELM